ncbi:peptidyl prolyl cis-trans isomerase Cyclophilin [Histoplasma capsulatum H143]|uniref:Peptidyl prolyl cis-trans isomerase Cyclophilin n=1 Tax=Ajellomyces capsulatus (strain H143) TaxID=544712 RepID=C6HJP7_AJECH|nr:peptidyl prolyl cis-trans isomerase Cyclophilin [Histoplasma capsulatum H143]
MSSRDPQMQEAIDIWTRASVRTYIKVAARSRKRIVMRAWGEGYLAQHAVSEEDRVATGQGGTGSSNSRPEDPMQGLEGLDVAGPKPE